jgi:hypothetical protein
MSVPYIPARDVDFTTWVDNFGGYVDINFAALFLGPGDVTAVDTAISDWDAAYALVANPATKTPVTVAAKDTQRATTESLLRLYASQINLNPAVTDLQRAALAITIRDQTKTPILPPTSFPELELIAALPGTHQLKYKDSDAVVGKAKAFGGRFVELRSVAALTPPASEDLVPTVGYQTKSPFIVSWTMGDAQKIAYYFARYISPRGGPGPWAPIFPVGII